MATMMRVFADEVAAVRAAEALMDAGAPGQDIQLLHGPVTPTTGSERVGTFDDEDARRERQGTFDDEDARKIREGSFDDTSGHRHDVREERRGSFADTDGLDHGPRHTRHTDSAAFQQAIVSAGIDRDQAMRALAGTSGGVVLLVTTAAVADDDISRLLR